MGLNGIDLEAIVDQDGDGNNKLRKRTAATKPDATESSAAATKKGRGRPKKSDDTNPDADPNLASNEAETTGRAVVVGGGGAVGGVGDHRRPPAAAATTGGAVGGGGKERKALKAPKAGKAAAAAAAKKPKASDENEAAGPTYASKIVSAIAALDERDGSSRPAIKKYLSENFDVDTEKSATHLKRAFKTLLEKGAIVAKKGSFKLPKDDKTGKKSVAKKIPTEKVAKNKTPAKAKVGKDASKSPSAKLAKSPKSPKSAKAVPKVGKEKVEVGPKKAAKIAPKKKTPKKAAPSKRAKKPVAK